MKINGWDRPQARTASFLLAIVFLLLFLTLVKLFLSLSASHDNLANLPWDKTRAVSTQLNLNQEDLNKLNNGTGQSKKHRSDWQIPVLLYHYISNNPNPNDKTRDGLSTSPSDFEKQMRFLADNGYTTIKIDRLIASYLDPSVLPKKPILLTFDDGYIDFFYNAFPVLNKYNFTATVFISTNLINKPGYLTWQMIKTLQQLGKVDFASHGVNHYDLTSLNSDKLLYELIESGRAIKIHLGKEVKYLAYPYGASNQQVIQAVKEVGYVAAFGTVKNFINNDTNLYSIPRLRPTQSNQLEDFIDILAKIVM